MCERSKYKVTQLVSSKEGEAKTFDPELSNGILTIARNQETGKKLIWTIGLDGVGDLEKSYLKTYTLNGIPVDKILITKFSSSDDISDIAVNKTQGFVLKTDDESAAGYVFVAAYTDESFYYGYNRLLSKVVQESYNPDEQNQTNGFDFNDKYLYTASDADIFTPSKILVFDFNFKEDNSFSFPRVNLPDNYIFVNVKIIDDLVYTVASPGFSDAPTIGGIVNVYNLDGTFIKTLINDPTLVKPWSIVKSPKNFGKYKCSFLIGSSDGTISVYNKRGEFRGKLKDCDGNIIVIQGLGSLKFKCNRLYYASYDNEKDVSIVGYISPKCH